MSKIRTILAALIVATGIGLAALPATNTYAVNVFDACSTNPDNEVCKAQGTDDAESIITTIINTLLIFAGLLAVIMIIISGFMYMTSSGDSGQITKAKNMLTYAIVGLIISIIAYAIVNFVVGIFAPPTNP